MKDPEDLYKKAVLNDWHASRWFKGDNVKIIFAVYSVFIGVLFGGYLLLSRIFPDKITYICNKFGVEYMSYNHGLAASIDEFGNIVNCVVPEDKKL